MVEDFPLKVNSSSIGTDISYFYRTWRSIVMVTETATGPCSEFGESCTHTQFLLISNSCAISTLQPESQHVNLSIRGSATYLFTCSFFTITFVTKAPPAPTAGTLSKWKSNCTLIKMKMELMLSFVPKCKINRNTRCTNRYYNIRNTNYVPSLCALFQSHDLKYHLFKIRVINSKFLSCFIADIIKS